MLYLKNTLGGLSRSLTDSALHSFQGRHRWWKLALFAGLFVLPGGSVGVALLAWAEHRRETKRTKTEKGVAVVAENGASALALDNITVITKDVAATITTTASAVQATGACQARGDASCRASARKLAR
ncbi:hypothetical protein [Paraburkholderia antibiotica]|uniref:Uncharacterized protein n=1 Tax=Paraburkholderia antibiotica TaxID=2728839 RepID=A0A7X9ZXS9_9BURK|nr:hypothetical protein [Paraburkholderia antibiotica]NML32181.1 hypothetical protein [Paraburkholderia antibiotica]